jgi:TPR repeat protein
MRTSKPAFLSLLVAGVVFASSGLRAEIVVKQAPPPAQDVPVQEPPPERVRKLNAVQKRKLADLSVRADTGDVTALLKLGWIYYRGEQATRSYGEAYRRFRAAADQGNLTAMLAAGYLLSRGLGITRDRNSARQFYGIAANAGYPRAYYLQSLLEGDLGTAQSTLAARQWLERAAAAGDSLAANALGGVYERQGQRATAQLWYRQAAAHGHAVATRNLARLGDNPEPQAQDQRLRELKERADAGDAAASYELATRYHRGDGVAVNYGEALRLYRLAAGLGNTQAQRMLSLISSRSSSAEQISAAWMQELSHLAVSDDAQAAGMASIAADEDPLGGLLEMTPQLSGGSAAATTDSGYNGASGTTLGLGLGTTSGNAATAPPGTNNTQSPQSQTLQRARALRDSGARGGQ